MRKYSFFSNHDSKEIDRLVALVHSGQFMEIAKLDRKKLQPDMNGYDSLKLMFHLIAVLKLTDKLGAIDVFRQLVFGNGLALYEKHDLVYLKFYAYNLLKSAFGETLDLMPSDIQGLKVEKPAFEMVSDDLKQLFIFQPAS